MRRVVRWAALAVLLGAFPAVATDGAERQYRIARRLAAEGSPEASAALRRVIELDPEGPRVDDALVEQARLLGVARWPEELGAVGVLPAREAGELLEQALRRFPEGDRAPEARYLRALLMLEPLPRRDGSAAKLELTAVATTGDPHWAAPARYALAWLHEQDGRRDRAFDAYSRMVVDDPLGEAGIRAGVGQARMLLLSGEFGAAAGRLQEVSQQAFAPHGAARLKELAVRCLLQRLETVRDTPADSLTLSVRSPTGFAPTPDGGLLLGDRKQDRVVQLDADGIVVEEWVLSDLQALIVDPLGRRLAAAGEFVYRLDPRGRATSLAPLGPFGPVSQLAADGTGGLWLLEKRGKSVGRVEPGADGPLPYWVSAGPRLESLVWDGTRLLAVDARTRSVIELDADGVVALALSDETLRPAALASGPGGRVAVLDARAGIVRFLHTGVDRLGSRDLSRIPVERATAVGLGPDGKLHVFDEAGARWVRVP